MKITPQLTALFENLIDEAINKLPIAPQEEIITDFHIQTNADNGFVRIADDNDETLAQISVEGCEEIDENEFRDFTAKILSTILNKKNKQKEFDKLAVFKPFSFLLEDDEHEIINELLIVDNDNIIIDDELLKGLDKELDDFLNHLLEN